MKIGLCWLVEVSWVSLVPPLDSGFRRNDECGGGGIQALLRLRSIIFVPMTRARDSRVSRDHDPTQGDSRIAPTRDSRGRGAKHPFSYR